MNQHPLDAIIARNTGFTSMEDLLNSSPNYRPSLDMREGWAREVADAYDSAMTLRRDARRAYRYGEDQAAEAAAKAMTPLQRAKAAVAEAYAEAQRAVRRDPELRALRWRRGRGRPMYALDAKGDRINDGGWDEFVGVWKDVQKLIDGSPGVVEIFVDGGIDCAANREEMDAFNYETYRYEATIWRRDWYEAAKP